MKNLPLFLTPARRNTPGISVNGASDANDDETARSQMPARRNTPGISVNNANGANDASDGAAQFQMPARRNTPGISGTAQSQKLAQKSVNGNGMEKDNGSTNLSFGGGGGADEDDEAESMEYEQILLKNTITFECQKLNGETFHGTVNYSEAKIKIFQDGLGLDPSLLDCVKITFNQCPLVTYKLNSEINVATSIKNPLFNFSRIYHSKRVLVTDRVDCKVIGIEPPKERIRRNQRNKFKQNRAHVRPPLCQILILKVKTNRIVSHQNTSVHS